MSRVGQHGSWSDRPPGSEGLDSHGLGVLGETTCLHLLAHERVGRLGLNVGRLPVIRPVNYVLAGRSIVFRSERGDKLRAAQNGAWACLEVDQFDRFEHSGWSVLATGRMVALPPRHSQELERLHVVPWALHGESWFVELAIEALSGRSIRRF